MAGRVWLVIVPEGDTVQFLDSSACDRPVAADLELFKRSTVADMANLMPLGERTFGVPVYAAERADLAWLAQPSRPTPTFPNLSEVV
jgi:hypothetical protein